ncbi:MAG: DUF4384 domain-containing protein [Candidatus Bathyarchaeia archaeon]
MSKHLTILTLIFCSLTIALAQDDELGQARGIFDTQTKQTASPGTIIVKRKEVLDHTKSKQQVQSVKKASHSPSVSSKKPSSALALKYSVIMVGKDTPSGYEPSSGIRNLTKMKDSSEGQAHGLADPERNFRNGDIIYLVFEPSINGHLYIFNLGSDGISRQMIYPDRDVGTDSKVKAGQPIYIGKLRIDPPSGVDRLTAILSPKPIQAFENATDLANSFEKEIESYDYQGIEEAELFKETNETMALYFATKTSKFLRAEIDIKHKD